MMENFKQLVENSERIFITAHISPDPDAVASLLVLGTTLMANYPEKSIRLGLEEKPMTLDFLNSYEKIEFGPVFEQVVGFKPNLFVLLDGNNYERVSRTNGAKLRDYIHSNGVKTITIDHHEQDDKDDVDVFLNSGSPATSQDVYQLCRQLNYKMPDGTAQTAMTGFFADTNGFLYAKMGKQAAMLDFAKELAQDGASPELAQNNLNNYTSDDIKVLAELIANLASESDYNYSYLTDDFIKQWVADGNSQQALQPATHTFLNDFIRNVDHRSWGFLAYKSYSDGEGIYTVSFRSREGKPDVALIAGRLGGGGHKPAAGARFEASSLEDALDKVKAVIKLSP